MALSCASLMLARSLDGGLVNGYRTLSVIGLTPQHRGVLYHHLFSSKAPGFLSESHEVQKALTTVSDAITPLKAHMPVSWLLDSGFDDVAVWRTLWEHDEHLVCRVKHPERLIRFQTRSGEWQAGDIAQARHHLRLLARAETMMVVQRGRQPHAKEQRVEVEVWAARIRLKYETNVRRSGEGEQIEKELWLVEVRL